MMRTDLAIEDEKISAEYLKSNEKIGEFTINHIKIKNSGCNKSKGEYITLHLPSLLNHGGFFEGAEKALSDLLISLLPQKRDLVLVAGLGNTEITPDALGPKTAGRIIATRHISQSLAKEINLNGIKKVAAISPGVLGQTGIEAAELILSVTNKIKPDAVIVIDALCAAESKRLGSTIQLSTAGISPGSGVKNARPEISSEFLKTPVIAIGVPTVIDATGILGESELLLTPKDIDLMIDRAATLISNAINISLQPEIEPEVLRALV